MRIQRKRTFTAWWLLSVFVSMMLLTSLHYHQPVASTADCVECDHHLQHHSHLTAATTSLHECLLCQFLSIPYVPAITLALSVTLALTVITSRHDVSSVVSEAGNLHLSRAPPVIL